MPCRHCVAAPVELEGTDRNETFENNVDYEKLLENGFSLRWDGISCNECEQSGGFCGFDDSNGAMCFCSDQPHRQHCYDRLRVIPRSRLRFEISHTSLDLRNVLGRNPTLPQYPFLSFKLSPNLTFFACFNLTPNDQIQDHFGHHRRVDCLMSPPTVYYAILETHVHEWNVSQDCHDCYDRGGQCVGDNMNKFHCREKGTRDFPYDIMDKISANKFLIHDAVLENYFNSKSCLSFENVSLPQSPFVSFTLISPNLTSFTCFDQRKDIKDYFVQYKNRSCDKRTVYYKTSATHVPAFDHLPLDCVMNQLPIKSVQEYSGDLFHLLSPNLRLEWHVSQDCYECNRGGGQCLANYGNEFYCSLTIPQTRNPPGSTNLKKILFIGGIIIAALTSTFIILFIFIRGKRARAKQEYEKDIELFLKNNGNLAPMRYKYSSIKKMTKSFSENLGKGGYGSVYKGQFPNGHLVAVKILNESNGNGEEFMNEVASISRTSHINIVALLGFCFEGSKRALIYDFMPNGSLEKFIGNTDST
ncbi:hypothetical protein C2S51_019823, partial [Perilla frutescens var. frutescens]